MYIITNTFIALRLSVHDLSVDPGGPVVIVPLYQRLAGSIPAGVDGFFSERKKS